MLIIRGLNYTDAASGIVLSVSGRPVHSFMFTGPPLSESDGTRCCFNTVQTPDDEHIMLETCKGM